MQSEYLFFEGLTTTVARAIPPTASPLVDRGTGSAAEDPGRLVSTLFERANLPAECYRTRALLRRVSACLRFLGATDAVDAARKIEEDPALVQATLNIALLGVTEFFRDPAVFELIRETVLPDLFSREPRLRIWSAGCSSGQELYSVAMLLSEMGRLRDCELLGTDCRREAIEQARCGVYDCDAVAGFERRREERFFARAGSSALVSSELRRAADWRVSDLCSQVEPEPWHLILWRNMAIYLEMPAAAGIWRQLSSALAPGGYIVGGKADHPPGALPLVRVAPCIYQRIDS